MATRNASSVVLAVLAAEFLGCSYGPQGMSSDAYMAAKKAAIAIRTLNEHALDSSLVYTPLLVEAERAVEEIGTAARREHDRNAFFQGKKCLAAIADERKEASDPELQKLSATVAANELEALESLIRDREP